MSFATSAAPPASAPATAKLLLPGVFFSFVPALISAALDRACADRYPMPAASRANPAAARRSAHPRCRPIAVRNRIRGFGQRRVHPRERELARVLGIVQRERHRGDDERRVLVAPWRRRRARQEIRKRPHRERGKAGVDAVAIRDDFVAIVRRQRRERGDARARACDARARCDRPAARQRRKARRARLPRGGAADPSRRNAPARARSRAPRSGRDGSARAASPCRARRARR